MQNPFEQLQILQPGPEHCFEEAVSHILRSTTSQSHRVRVHRGDEGVDTFTGTWGGDGALEVFQVKYFLRKWEDSQKEQIRSSYVRASENSNYNLSRWILVVPTNPTAADYKWLHTWAAAQDHPIDIMDGAELTDRLLRPECGTARQLLRKWGVQGLPGGPSLFPTVTTAGTERFAVALRLRLENRGDQSARTIRLNVSHSETNTMAFAADEYWWADVGRGILNPRSLESSHPVNPGDDVPIMTIPFLQLPPQPITVRVRITAEDSCPVDFSISLTPNDLLTGAVRIFEPGGTFQVAPSSFKEAKPKRSELAQELLEILSVSTLKEPALHVIVKALPSKPAHTGFFVAEMDATGGTATLLRREIVNVAVRELLDGGYLRPPIPGPGTEVYEWVRDATS